MKQYSMIMCLLRHPLKVISRTLGLWLVCFIVLMYLEWTADFLIYFSLFASFMLMLKRVQKKTNEELALLSNMSPQQKKVYKKNKRNSSWWMKLYRYANKPLKYNPFGGLMSGMESAIYNAFKVDGSGSSSSSYDSNREANERARKRWQAQDNYKKARWDAMDMAKRGKDIGASQRANDAQYWKNQANKW